MPRKGNLPGLLKAVNANPNMSRRTKEKARAKIRQKLRRTRSRSFRPRSRGQGFEGFKEATLAGAKLVSTPIHQAVEGYHLVNGARKAYRAVEKWLDENT